MGIYLVTMVADEDSKHRFTPPRLQKLFPNTPHHVLSSSVAFLAMEKGSAQETAARLGYDEAKGVHGLVFRLKGNARHFRDCSGFATPALWSWLGRHS